MYGDWCPHGEAADEETFSNGLDAALGEAQEAFERAWQEFSANERRGPWRLSHGLARSGQGESLFEKSTLLRFRLTKSTAQYVRDALTRRGELRTVDGNAVELVDPLFETWIASVRRAR